MRAEIDGQLKCDFTFAIIMNDCFSYTVNGNGGREFFERLEIVLLSSHIVGAARVVYPGVKVIHCCFENLDTIDTILRWGILRLARRLRFHVLHVIGVSEFSLI